MPTQSANTSTSRPTIRTLHPLRALGQEAGRRLFLDQQIDFWMGKLDRAWSLHDLRARVVDVIDETHDTRTFVLAPNHHWRGHRAGQHTVVEVEMDGVRVRRCYSISSAPGERFISITVKRQPGGRVSSWIHDNLRSGSVIGLAPATGDFVVDETPRPLLMLAGGSGITPLMSMVRDLAARGAIHDVGFVCFARSPADLIFGRELGALASRHDGLRVVVFHGLFDEANLAAAVPDLALRETYLCGPAPLMTRVETMWTEAGVRERLHQERFVAPVLRSTAAGSERITLTQSGRTIEMRAADSLLVGLEQAGEKPAHGCRMGICGTCKTRKKSGTVTNLLTGQVSSDPDEDIQLCISTPCSDVELAL